MAKSRAFDEKVSARVRAAQQILGAPDLLAKFEGFGGLASDLEHIAQTGLAAEALNHAQGDAKSSGKTATIDVLEAFEALQREYSLVLGVARAVRGDLAAERADAALISKMDDIIKNEAQVSVTVERVLEDGTKKTGRILRRATQEGLRAEIEKDAVALAAFTEVAARFRARRCDRARLDRLRADAAGLSGKLGDRVAKKGEGKTATKEENAMVAAQRLKWGSVHRLLAAVANEDERVRLLLRDAGR